MHFVDALSDMKVQLVQYAFEGLPEGADLLAGEGAEDGDGIAADSRKEMASVTKCNHSAALDCKILHRPACAESLSFGPRIA